MKTILTLKSLSLSAKVLNTLDHSQHQWVAELKNEKGHVISGRAYKDIRQAAQAALAHITFDCSLLKE